MTQFPLFRSLRAKIIYQMLLISLLPILIIGGASYYRLAQSVQKTRVSLQESQTHLSQEVVGANHANQAALIAREIDYFIYERMMDVLAWATAPVVIEAAQAGYAQAEAEGLSEQTIDEIEAKMAETRSLMVNHQADSYLKQQLAHSPHFGEVFFTDAHGYNVALTNRTSDFVQSDETWWQMAWSEGIHVSEVSYDESAGVWSVAISVRIDTPQTGKRLGVMKSILSITLIQEVVDLHATQLSDGLIVICTSEGLLLAETSSTHDRDRIMNSTILPSNPDLAELSKSLTESDDNGYYLGKETLAGFAQTAGGDFFQDIPGFDGFGWWVIVQQPKDVVFAPLDGLSRLANELMLSRQTMGITLLGIALFVVVGVLIITFFVSHLISQPIQRLTNAVAAISSGNLAVRTQESNRQDEIGILGRGFNGMADQLTIQMNTLEERVKQRTHELTQANRLLRQEVRERKRAEEELQRHQDHLEYLVNERTQELSQALNTLQTAQTQLVESEKMAALGGLVAGVAHEINTPLGVAITAASTLEDETHSLAATYQNGQLKRAVFEESLHVAKQSSHLILANLHRAGELVYNFKQVAVDQTSQEKRLFGVKQYLEETLFSLIPQLHRDNYTVEVHGDERLQVYSYPGVFSQIITNLVMNSLTHAYPRGDTGSLQLNLYQQKQRLILEYSDDGFGIPSENLPKIFEPFFTTARSQGGTGLGLHIVYNLVVQQLKGTIQCESQVGVGTKFILSLPF